MREVCKMYRGVRRRKWKRNARSELEIRLVRSVEDSEARSENKKKRVMGELELEKKRKEE